jgi:large subunit ribosomal protein L29
MKAQDLRERSVEDLKELDKSLAKDLFQSRIKNFTNRLDDTSALGKNRKDIARVKTLLKQKEMGLEPVKAELVAGSVKRNKVGKKS